MMKKMRKIENDDGGGKRRKGIESHSLTVIAKYSNEKILFASSSSSYINNNEWK